jgi:hypothetical protein
MNLSVPKRMWWITTTRKKKAEREAQQAPQNPLMPKGRPVR